MVVVGARRLGRMHRVFAASAGAATAEKASCPVLVVREGASHTLQGTRVVVGIDGPASRSAAEFAFSEARRTTSGVTAVHGWQLNTADLGSLVSPDAERKQMEARGQEILAEVLGPLSAVYPEVDVGRFVVEGTPAEQLEKISVNARLLVVGSRKLSPRSALVLGSVSRRVISRGHCPVAVMASGSVP
jgi:nucleotide-binding universal stress UspA family protein